MTAHSRRRLRRRVPSRWLAVGAVFVLTASAGVGGWHLLRGGETAAAEALAPEPVDPVAEAVRGWEARPFEGRLTGGFDYAPFDPEAITRAVPLHTDAGRKLLRVEAAVYRGPEQAAPVPVEDGEAAARGKILLLRGQAAEAVDTFEDLRLSGKTDARALSDLSAAYLARAAAEGTPGDLAWGLEMAEQALQENPSLLEAQFNRALALEALFLDRAAITAWEEYLILEPGPSWTAEAESRLNELKWRTAEVASRGLGDGLYRPSAADRENTPARALLEEGISLYQDLRLDEAAETLSRAREEMAVSGSSVALWVDYYLALCRYQKRDHREALAAIDRLLEVAVDEDRDGAAVAARALQLAGLIYAIRGSFGEMLDAYHRSALMLHAASEPSGWAGVQVSLAAAYDSLGDFGSAWRHRYLALGESGGMNGYGRLRVYTDATSAVARAGLPRAAQYFVDEAVNAAEAANFPSGVVEALRRRALLKAAAGAQAQALADLSEAESRAAALADEKVALVVRGEVLFARAQILLEKDSSAALDCANEALEIARSMDNEALEMELLSLRAGAYRRSGDLASAESSLAAAEELLESQLHQLRGRNLRRFVFEKSKPLFDELVEMALERSDANRARAALEKVHKIAGPLILEAALGSPRRTKEGFPMMTAADGAAAPNSGNVTQIEYYTLDDRLVISVQAGGEVALKVVPLSRQRLGDLIELAKRNIATGIGGNFETTSTEIFDLIVEPVRSFLPPGTRLVIVPDGPLVDLPFAALRSSKDGRFLVEDHEIVISRSGGLAERALRAAFFRGLLDSQLLAIINPKSGGAYADLPALPATERELGAILALAPGATVLKEAEATVANFMKHAADYPIIHFAGHAISNSEDPLQSSLILTSSEHGDDGLLPAGRLVDRRLDGVRLVVLAACRSAGGDSKWSGGINSVSEAFLAAGAEMVVGSLWEVEDEASGELVRQFYRALASGLAAPSALREAQRSLLSSTDPTLRSPSTWAAFQIAIHGI